MQRSGTEAIRTQIQPSKPKRKITNITNSQNTKSTVWSKEARWPSGRASDSGARGRGFDPH